MATDLDAPASAPLDSKDQEPIHQLPPTDAKPSWKVALKRAGAKFSADQCTDVAAMLTYYSVLALFPGLIAVVSLVGVFDVKAQSIIEVVADVMGTDASDSQFNTAKTVLENLNTADGAGVALLVGVVGALWSASGYVGGFSRALNRIYGIGEGRSVFKLRPWLLLVTAIEVILIVVVLLAMVLSGGIAESIGDRIGLGSTAVKVWNVAKIPVVALIIVIIISMLYWATPNVQKPRRMALSWGALVGFVSWIVATGLFVTYVGMTGGSSYTKTYGAFAGVVMFLLWLWITNLALLFGAELDAELERTRQLKSGLPAERRILLPARDTAGLEKAAEKEQAAIEDAHELRLSSGKDVERVGDSLVIVPAHSVAAAVPVSSVVASSRDMLPRSARTDASKDAASRQQARRESPSRLSAGSGQDGSGTSTDTTSTDTKEDAVTLGRHRYDAEAEREQIDSDRAARRAAALTEAAKNRQVRDRLEEQEARAAAEKKKREQAAVERLKIEQAIRDARSPQERWAEVDEGRARYAKPAPPVTAERLAVRSERAQRRAEYDAKIAEAKSRPKSSDDSSKGDSSKADHKKPKKPKKEPMPSALRTEVTDERAQRRADWYAGRRPEPYVDPMRHEFRRDRRG